ncbi:50S ribosomal protein L4 [bacterium CG10_46_32]|nr:MAG: 50S ribosomal protein L4 [bacterium CG10_46_32]PIR56411.1 MAG: 50S ribosomal protein L4 [Parcubacteria group bacterium CG10_big_fil_rev_8_21_14_0_10_46_32]
MATVKTYNLEGAETGSVELLDSVFNETAHASLIYQVVRVARINERQPLAHTKTRAEVRGGGKKPWAQKGTGRARHGSIRSPLWKGGGVTFGPRNESITKRSVPTKMRKRAIRAAFSDHVRTNAFIVVDDLGKLEKPSAKKFISFFKALKLASKKVLFISDEGLEYAILSVRNLTKVKAIRLENANILDLLTFGTILIGRDSLEKLTKQLS